MLTIICGEDSVASREYFNKLKNDYQKKNYEIQYVEPSTVGQLSDWLGQSFSLFAEKKIFITENLLRKTKKNLDKLVYLKETTIIDWENQISSYELKIPRRVLVKEFKLPTSIFKLLDACYPGNLKTFLNILHQLPDKMEDGFIFIMLARQIRNLLLIKSGQTLGKLQSWQIARLKTQAKHWRLPQLTTFYDGLYRIEVATKTSTNPFNIRHSLDILACYIL